LPILNALIHSFLHHIAWKKRGRPKGLGGEPGGGIAQLDAASTLGLENPLDHGKIMGKSWENHGKIIGKSR